LRVGTVSPAKAFEIEISKARQLALFHSLGIAAPRSRIINRAEEAVRVAAEIGFPLIIKPNIGGRGARIVRINSSAELRDVVAAGQIELGIDQTALVQEFVPARGGHIHRGGDARRKVSLRDESLHHRRKF